MLKIQYEDDALIVCVATPASFTHTKNMGQRDMESMLRTYRMQKGEPSYIGVVHRLDQPVSGLMVFAKTKEAAAHLSRQIASKAADKYYYAVTDGIPEKQSGKLTDYLLRDGRTNFSRVVSDNTQGAKRAELSYEVLEQKNGRALVRILLGTGRHHQIRVQFAHAGTPLVGDRKYNFKENIRQTGEGLMLCSYKLAFVHPVTKKKLVFEMEHPFSL